MKFEYTKGEWIVKSNHPEGACLVIENEDGCPLASLFTSPKNLGKKKDDGSFEHDPEREANARMMAAAPEMFDLLFDIFEKNYPSESYVRKFREIRSKILGSSECD